MDYYLGTKTKQPLKPGTIIKEYILDKSQTNRKQNQTV